MPVWTFQTACITEYSVHTADLFIKKVYTFSLKQQRNTFVTCHDEGAGGWNIKKGQKSLVAECCNTSWNKLNNKKTGGKGMNSINRGLKISTTSTNIRHLPKKIVQLSLGLKESTLCTYTPHTKLFPTRRYATRGKKKKQFAAALRRSRMLR